MHTTVKVAAGMAIFNLVVLGKTVRVMGISHLPVLTPCLRSSSTC